MWSIIIVLIIGMVIGSKITPTDQVKSITGKFQFIGVMILIGSMGAALGLNDTLLSNLNNMGLEALVFAVLTSLFSILVVYLSSRLLLKGK